MSREIRNDLKTKKASIKLLIRAPFKLSENLLSKSEAGRKGKGGRGGGGGGVFYKYSSKDM